MYLVSGLEIPKVTDLEFGQTVSGAVERQSAHFYKINVSEKDMINGIIVNCLSNSGDKFKVVFFDKVYIITLYLSIVDDFTLKDVDMNRVVRN